MSAPDRAHDPHRGLAPLGAALGLAVAAALAGTMALRHPASHPARAAVKLPPTAAAPSLSPIPRPPAPRLDGAAVSADLSGGVLVFGGITASGGTLLNPQSVLTDQTWTWNGSWTQLHPGITPSPRSAASMVADPPRGNVLLFGGEQFDPGATGGTRVELADTWTWNGSTWTQLHPRHHPDATDSSPLLAYDPATREVVGIDDRGATWTWAGADWTQRHLASGPQPDWGGGVMAWDPTTRTVLLADEEVPPTDPNVYGGGNTGSVDRLWSWTGSAWVRLRPSVEAGIANRYPAGAYLAADPSGGLLALLTSTGKAGPEPPEVRHWNGRTWSTIDPTDAPIRVDGMVVTATGRLLAVDLSDGYEGDHPVQEWTGTHWVVRD
jgi:hypothetical protein